MSMLNSLQGRDRSWGGTFSLLRDVEWCSAQLSIDEWCKLGYP